MENFAYEIPPSHVAFTGGNQQQQQQQQVPMAESGQSDEKHRDALQKTQAECKAELTAKRNALESFSTRRDKDLKCMHDHFRFIANLPPDVRYFDDPNIRNTGSAFIFAYDLYQWNDSSILHEAAVYELTKQARVRSLPHYLKILLDFEKLMCFYEEWRKSIGLLSIWFIGTNLFLKPVHKRWRLMRMAVALCSEAARRE